jgi:hypothetical protein
VLHKAWYHTSGRGGGGGEQPRDRQTPPSSSGSGAAGGGNEGDQFRVKLTLFHACMQRSCLNDKFGRKESKGQNVSYNRAASRLKLPIQMHLRPGQTTCSVQITALIGLHPSLLPRTARRPKSTALLSHGRDPLIQQHHAARVVVGGLPEVAFLVAVGPRLGACCIR